MAYTVKDDAAEFWMLTQGVLQDSRVDAAEARVLLTWLREHRRGGEFDVAIARLDGFLSDGFIDRFESGDIISSIAGVLRTLRAAAAADGAAQT